MVWQHRILNVAWELKFGISAASLMTKLLMLSNNDTAIIAQMNSIHWAANGLLQLWGTPLSGALSDAIGRKPLWALGRLTKLFWFMGSHYATSMPQYVAACILAWGVTDFGTLSVQEAAWADVFGSRPELSSRLKASNQVWTGISGLVGPVLGAEILKRFGPAAGFQLASLVCAIEGVMVLCTRESNPAGGKSRKPFLLSKAGNPFASIGVLFRHGPGLRGLSIAAGLLRSVVTVYSTIEPFRLGPLGWSPAEQSYYSAILSGLNSGTTALVGKPLLRLWGNRKVFELGSTAAAVAYLGLSQSCRPAGAAHQLRRTLQFCACKLILMTPWSEPSFSAIGPMIVKQGLAVSDGAGRGELSAAYDGLASLIGVFSPFLWAGLYTFFAAGQEAVGLRGVLARLLGPGGHFVVAGLLRLTSAAVLHSVKASDLFIEDEAQTKVAAMDKKPD